MTDYRMFVEDYASRFGYDKVAFFKKHVEYYKFKNNKFVTLTHKNDDKYVTFSSESGDKLYKAGDLFLSTLENSEIETNLFS